MLCPCGTQQNFKQCCFAIHQQTQIAATPEQLMRSRYSAYAVKNAHYIYDTYAKSAQTSQSVEEIKQWANECQWLSLDVIAAQPLTEAIEQPTVEFSALYLSDNKVFKLHELSRFIKENNQWRYLDGDIKAHHQIQQLKRNDPCPCNSGKKYKKCCSS